MYSNDKKKQGKKSYFLCFININMNQIYPIDFAEEHDTNHILHIIKYITEGFIRKTQTLLSKRATLDLQDRFSRQNSRHSVIFKGL